jgi:hypothetical protein
MYHMAHPEVETGRSPLTTARRTAFVSFHRVTLDVMRNSRSPGRRSQRAVQPPGSTISGGSALNG